MTTAFFVFIVGAIFGSFSSAILHRARTGGSVVRGRSQCPTCNHVLGVRDLIPLVSWAVTRGRCRYCKAPISWQYPALELASGALFVAAFWSSCNSFLDIQLTGACLAQTGQTALFLFLLLLVFVYDARWTEIPDSFSIAGIVAGLAFNLARKPHEWPWYVLAVAVGAAFFGLQYIVSKGKWIGGGDILLGAMMGALVGWPGVLVAIGLAYMLGLVYVLALLITGKKKMADAIPLGPLLTLGTALVLLTNIEMYFVYLFQF